MREMREVHDRIEGPFLIEEDLAVHGMIVGGATLRRGVKLVLHGMITGNLVVEPMARAIIHGMVQGAVLNDGGRVELFGVVDTIADLAADAVTVIDAVARVRGAGAQAWHDRLQASFKRLADHPAALADLEKRSF